ncbi:MAG: molybdopterin biosynthesis protein, partial [Planctomycetota bacterium]
DVDVPGFDRSNVDGFAVRSGDTAGATELEPKTLRVIAPAVLPGRPAEVALDPGTAIPIATGAPLPRGADAVVMVEDTEWLPAGEGSDAAGGPDQRPAARGAESREGGTVLVRRSVVAGQHVAPAGSDIACGETVLFPGCRITSREIGVLSAIGRSEVTVFRRPRVAILSTGDELVAAGTELPPAHIYDSNGPMLAAAVRELGGEPVCLGVVGDDAAALQDRLQEALSVGDVVLLSGGTSKGAGDLCFRAVERLQPGVIVHGVALKPGKPLCLAAAGRTPVVVLPGFPTSALFTFHEFVAPMIRELAGTLPERRGRVRAVLPQRVNSERGRTEYLLVHLVGRRDGWAAYPMGKGSGSVTTFSRADGFVTIPQHTERLNEGESVDVQLLGRDVAPADLTIIGSHCLGLDVLVDALWRRRLTTKLIAVGSLAGLRAAQREECDVAGIHLLHEQTMTYNTPFLTPGLKLVPGYRRRQGVVFRCDDDRLAEADDIQAVADRVRRDGTLRLANRNAGSGTRILIDRLLQGVRPPGYDMPYRSHNAVAAAVAQGRADWAVAIEPVARLYGLAFVPLREEDFDFVVPARRWERPAVVAFRQLLSAAEVQRRLSELGFQPRCFASATPT